MKKILLFLALATVVAATACKKDSINPQVPGDVPKDLPRTNVPADMQGQWMYGKFSMTEYWSQNPNSYIGNALEFAIAFQFEANGEYTQYFTSSSSSSGATIYQQSVTKGTVEINTVNKTFKTHPASAHYKRTKNNQVLEERDMAKSELSAPTNYSYTASTEATGNRALQITLNGTSSPLTFLKK